MKLSGVFRRERRFRKLAAGKIVIGFRRRVTVGAGQTRAPGIEAEHPRLEEKYDALLRRFLPDIVPDGFRVRGKRSDVLSRLRGIERGGEESVKAHERRDRKADRLAGLAAVPSFRPETLRGVGAIALGYAAGPAPEAAPRKENYIVHV